MKLIVGLGNPGPQYETTRHNVGFLAIDRLVDRWKASGPVTKNQGQVFVCNSPSFLPGENIYLIKPQTFMNLSGKCVGPLFHFYHCSSEDLIVIHDDVDLNPLSIRIKTGGGTGGHNGLKSIDEHLGRESSNSAFAVGGTKKSNYHRIRIGIGRSETGAETAGHVLQRFTDSELEALDPLLDKVAEAAEAILKGQIQAAMNKFHR